MTAAFEAWLAAVFDHPVAEPDWYWDDSFDEFWVALDLTESVTVEYLTRLWLTPSVLGPYSHEQVARGIWFLVGEASPGETAYALRSATVDRDARCASVRAMSHFFRDFVAPAAPAPPDTEDNPLHVAAYMWWDILPLHGGSEGGEPELHRACLDAMRAILAIPNDLCQMAALHGLNHWQPDFEAEVRSAIRAFLEDTPRLSARIREYAALAAEGASQ